MGQTHPDTNASLKIFEMNKAHAFQQQRETLQTLHLTLTQWRLCSMQILLFSTTQPRRPTPPPILLQMEESQRGKSPALNAN